MMRLINIHEPSSSPLLSLQCHYENSLFRSTELKSFCKRVAVNSFIWVLSMDFFPN